MKSFKHIISYACNKKCSYCINEILVHNEHQVKSSISIHQAYKKLAAKGYDHIMISGGEPFINRYYPMYALIAKNYFSFISVISAHKGILSHSLTERDVDDVLFSFHKEYLDDWKSNIVNINIPVYASMVMETFDKLSDNGKYSYFYTLSLLQEMGFSGATIRQTYPNGKEVPKLIAPKNFSLRIYNQQHCVEDWLLLLPDLSTTTQKEFV